MPCFNNNKNFTSRMPVKLHMFFSGVSLFIFVLEGPKTLDPKKRKNLGPKYYGFYPQEFHRTNLELPPLPVFFLNS